MNNIMFPTELKGFINTETLIGRTVSEREIYLIRGTTRERDAPLCGKCGCKMHVHGSKEANMSHIPIGSRFSAIRLEKRRYKCPSCGRTAT